VFLAWRQASTISEFRENIAFLPAVLDEQLRAAQAHESLSHGAPEVRRRSETDPTAGSHRVESRV